MNNEQIDYEGSDSIETSLLYDIPDYSQNITSSSFGFWLSRKFYITDEFFISLFEIPVLDLWFD